MDLVSLQATERPSCTWDKERVPTLIVLAIDVSKRAELISK